MEKEVNNFSVGLVVWQVLNVILIVLVLYFLFKLFQWCLRYFGRSKEV